MKRGSLRQRIGVFLLTGLILSTLSLRAQQPIFRDTLSNGIPLLYYEDSLRTLVGLSLVVRAGSQIDAQGSDGANALWSRLFWERGPDSLRYAAWAARRGILPSSQHSLSHTQFTLFLPPWRLPEALSVLGTAMDDPAYPAGDADLARKAYAVVLQALDNNPDVFLERQTEAEMWGDRFPEMHLYGSYPDLYSLPAKTYRDIHRTYLHPANILLVATGPVPAPRFMAMADSLLGRWESGKPAPYPPLAAMPRLPQPRYEVFTNELAEQPKVRMTWAIPGAYQGSDAVRLAEWFLLAAQSKAGPFYRRLVASGLAQDLEWSYTPTRGPGQLSLSFLPNAQHIRDCLVAVGEGLGEMAGSEAFWRDIEKGLVQGRRLLQARHTDDAGELLYFTGRAWASGVLEESLEGERVLSVPDLVAFCKEYLWRRPHVAGLLINTRMGRSLDLEREFRPVEPLPAVVVVEEPVLATVDSSAAALTPAELDESAWSEDERAWLADLRIYFNSSSFDPDSASLRGLQRVAKLLGLDPEARLFVNGYADGQGDGVYNYQLSIQRAESVKRVLESRHGIAPDRLLVKGWGEAFAEYPDDSPRHMALNRRVTFTLVKEDDSAL